MACDSCWTYNGTQTTSLNKIVRLSSGALLGEAGDNDSRAIHPLFDKVKRPQQLPLPKALAETQVEYAGILALPNGSVFIIDIEFLGGSNGDNYKGGIWPASGGIAAVGSGGDLALGAMEAGKSAAEAVRIACKRDVNSRLPIHVMHLKASR